MTSCLASLNSKRRLTPRCIIASEFATLPVQSPTPSDEFAANQTLVCLFHSEADAETLRIRTPRGFQDRLNGLITASTSLAALLAGQFGRVLSQSLPRTLVAARKHRYEADREYDLPS